MNFHLSWIGSMLGHVHIIAGGKLGRSVKHRPLRPIIHTVIYTWTHNVKVQTEIRTYYCSSAESRQLFPSRHSLPPDFRRGNINPELKKLYFSGKSDLQVHCCFLIAIQHCKSSIDWGQTDAFDVYTKWFGMRIKIYIIFIWTLDIRGAHDITYRP